TRSSRPTARAARRSARAASPAPASRRCFTSTGSARSAMARTAWACTRASGAPLASERSLSTAAGPSPLAITQPAGGRPRGPTRPAEEGIAAVLGGELLRQLARPAGPAAQPQVGQGRQRLVGTLVVEVGVTVIGAEEAVADADLVVAAVVLVVADEDVQLVV